MNTLPMMMHGQNGRDGLNKSFNGGSFENFIEFNKEIKKLCSRAHVYESGFLEIIPSFCNNVPSTELFDTSPWQSGTTG